MLNVAQVDGLHVLLDACQRLVADIVAVGFDECAQELYALTNLADVEFTHVELQAQFVGKELAHLGNLLQQPLATGIHHCRIVNISTIMLAKNVSLHKLVEWIHIYVGV